MRLSFDFSYADYDDSVNWPPRLRELRTVMSQLSREDPAGLPDGALLDSMENVEELMRYYTAITDYQQLEAVMRLDHTLIREGGRRGLTGIPFQYFRLEFERVNAMLYRGSGQHRKSAEGYQTAADIAARCADDLRRDIGLEDKQKLYVGWACAEVMSEAATAFDTISEHAGALAYCHQSFSLLEWLEPYMGDYAGIQEKAAELYCNYGGIFFQNGDVEKGRASYRHSVSTFELLDRRYDSGFMCARALWAMAHHGLQEFLCTGDAQLMLTCERKCRAALDTRLRDGRSVAVAQAALALILMQKGSALQQGGDIAGAVEQTRQSVSLCKNSLDALERDAGGEGAVCRLAIGSITARLFSSYVGAMDALGVQLYSAGQPDEAKKVLQEALALLGKQSEYGLAEIAVTMVRAECMNYLAFIALDEGNADEVEFYAQQAVTQTSAIIGKYDNSVIARIQSYASSLLAEYYLNAKNKPKALQYAQIGLTACAEWQRLEPQGGQPALVELLEKYKKKASRKFF